MKKVFFSLLVLAATMNVMAVDFTTKARLTVKGTTTNNSSYITVGTTASAVDLNATLNTTNRLVYLYVDADSKQYQTYIASPSLVDLPLVLQTYTDAQYTITASQVIGDALVLYDKATGKTKDMVEGATYTFEAAANSAIADRFVINPSHVQTAFVCQVAGGLSFHGDQAYTGLQVLDENDVVVEAAFDLAAGEDKFVAIAAAGRYYIKNGEQKIYFVVK